MGITKAFTLGINIKLKKINTDRFSKEPLPKYKCKVVKTFQSVLVCQMSENVKIMKSRGSTKYK